MISSEKLQKLALLFESSDDLPTNNNDLCELIDILNTGDQKAIEAIEKLLQKYKTKEPHCTTLLSFINQYHQVCLNTALYDETLHTVKDNLSALEQRKNAEIKQVPVSSYFKILELAGHHISMYESQEDRIHNACLKLDKFLTQNNKELTNFKQFFLLEQESKSVFESLDKEFQTEIKNQLHSGDILHPSTEKEEKIIPGLHDNESFWDKIYFWFKNKLTKHAHSALMVYDKADHDTLHYSHVVDRYQNNKVELHHLLYSEIYRVKTDLFNDQEVQNPENKDVLTEYRTIHENLYELTKEQSSHSGIDGGPQPKVNLENNTFRKIMAGFVNLLYRFFSSIGHWFAKDTKPDNAISAVLTTPSVNDSNGEEPVPTQMFCSEFVENTMIIAASQSFALFDKWKINRRSKYLPPEALAEHLEKEGLTERVSPEQLDIPLARMFQT